MSQNLEERVHGMLSRPAFIRGLRRRHGAISRRRLICAWLVLTLWPLLDHNSASAQFNGFNTRGDYGLLSASQPPPGWYVIAPMYLNYNAYELRDANGDTVFKDVGDSLDVNAWAGGLIWVSEKTLLGGNYSFQLFPAWTNERTEIPGFGIDETSSTGFGDLYLQPINLGWRTPRFDFTAGVGVFAPTGRYEFLADDNKGLGMWGFELFGGMNAYFDDEKRWHFAVTAFYETHSEKEGTDITVGDVLTLEGGLGYSFLDGAASVGIAYFAQWKVTDDDLGALGDTGSDLLPPELADIPVGKNRIFGAGPELSLPLVLDDKLVAVLGARYLWDFGARTQLQGSTFVFTATFPIPSVSVGNGGR